MNDFFKSKYIHAMVFAIVCTLPGGVQALVIEHGLDYFETLEAGEIMDFGNGPVLVPFKGHKIHDPFDTNNFPDVSPTLGKTDTVVERIDDTIDITPLGSDTIDIEMVALSLQSVAPVEVTPGSFFDIFVMLDLGADLLPNTADDTPSMGTMTINLDTTGQGGTYTSLMTLEVDIFLVAAGINPITIADIVANNAMKIDRQIVMDQNPCAWSTAPGGTARMPYDGPNFFTVGVCDHHTGGDFHSVKGVPEPATLVLFSAGIGLLGWKRRRM